MPEAWAAACYLVTGRLALQNLLHVKHPLMLVQLGMDGRHCAGHTLLCSACQLQT